jgi:two-component system, LuxR family, sensor kinase FixL
MNWVTLIWSMAASTCLTLAIIQFIIWCHNRTMQGNLLLFFATLATAGLTFCELWLWQSKTVGEYATVVRWGHVPFWVLTLSLVAFVRINVRAGRLWLAWTICGLRTLSLILNFIFTPNLNFLEITDLRYIRMLGELIPVAVGTPNPWMLVGQMSIALFLVFLADAAFTLWRGGERSSKLLMIIIMALFIAVALSQYVRWFWGISRTSMTASMFYLGVVLIMAWEVSLETVWARRLSADLDKKNEFLALAADSAGIGLWSWDFKNNIIWATDTTRQLYGFSSDEPITLNTFLSKLHCNDRDMVTQAFRKCIQEGSDYRYNYRIVMPDGSIRWLRILAKPFFSPDNVSKGMSGVSIDITERKQMLLELQQKRDELAHFNRVSTIGQLASTLAHELNQPLGAILRNAEAAEIFLQDPSPDLDEVRAILEDIRKDDQRAGEVIDRMRSMMRLHEIKQCRLDLNSLVEEIISLVQPNADKRQARIVKCIAPALPPIWGDRVQLQQVLLNLLVNALDAFAGNLTKSPLVTLSARPVGATVEVTVSDNGPGIPEDKILHVFEPFFSTKPKGLGMGLAISQNIITSHGGRLWAKNNEEGGVTLNIALPSAKGVDEK